MVLWYLCVVDCCSDPIYLISCTEAVILVMYAEDAYGKWFSHWCVCSMRGIGSLYIMVSAEKWVVTCVSGNGPLYGVRFWYQLLSGMISKVIV